MPLLNTGDPFPQLTINTNDGQALTIPDAFAGDFAVVLFNRGAWCPFCTAQLRAFERASATLAETGIRVVALSVDDKETAAEMAAKNKLTFPVGYGADAPAVSALTGAFVNPDPVYLQSTGFVLDPAGNVIVSVYSSGAIGRLVPDDVVGPVGYEEGHTSGLRLLRVAARARAEHGRAAVGLLYEVVSGEIFDASGAAELTAATRGSREFVAPLLAAAGLPADLADALDDTRWDDEIRAEGEEALSLTGKDVGTPIIHFSPPEGTALFGPVISRLPSPEDAVRLW